MYQISRSIFRRLAPRVIADPGDPSGSRNRLQVLEACEAAMVRMAKDRRYFAHPARTLFTSTWRRRKRRFRPLPDLSRM